MQKLTCYVKAVSLFFFKGRFHHSLKAQKSMWPDRRPREKVFIRHWWRWKLAAGQAAEERSSELHLEPREPWVHLNSGTPKVQPSFEAETATVQSCKMNMCPVLDKVMERKSRQQKNKAGTKGSYKLSLLGEHLSSSRWLEVGWGVGKGSEEAAKGWGTRWCHCWKHTEEYGSQSRGRRQHKDKRFCVVPCVKKYTLVPSPLT